MATPVLEKIYLQLKQDLFAGTVHKEGRVATESILSKRYNVSVATLRKAVGRLVEEGILERQQGRGTFMVEEKSHSDVASLIEDQGLTIGHAPRFLFQDEIDKTLIRETLKNTKRKTLSQVDDTTINVPGDWQECDIIQISHINLHVPVIEEHFMPVPESLKSLFTAGISARITETCSSYDGRLLIAPFVSKPNMFYAHMPSLQAAGIPLPLQGWTWDDFLDICKKLKAIGKMPFGMFPSPGCFFEHLLYQAGGDFFGDYGDVSLKKEPFMEMLSFLKTMHSEKLYTNLYKLPRSFPDFMQNLGTSMCTVGPLLGNFLKEKSSEWTFLPFPKNKNSKSNLIIMGWGVPKTCRNADLAWKFIADTFSAEGKKRTTSLPIIYPPWNQSRNDWKCYDIAHPEIVKETIENSNILPSRKAYKFWIHDYLTILLKAMQEEITPEAALEQASTLLQSRQFKVDHFSIL